LPNSHLAGLPKKRSFTQELTTRITMSWELELKKNILRTAHVMNESRLCQIHRTSNPLAYEYLSQAYQLPYQVTYQLDPCNELSIVKDIQHTLAFPAVNPALDLRAFLVNLLLIVPFFLFFCFFRRVFSMHASSSACLNLLKCCK
jgi:hypothetical protein